MERFFQKNRDYTYNVTAFSKPSHGDFSANVTKFS